MQVAHPLSDCQQERSTRRLYFDLLNRNTALRELELATSYLQSQLGQVENTDCDLPEDRNDLHAWMQKNTATVGRDYRQYLDGRKIGAPRRYFRNRSHALYFLALVAPTKMVDGAWLYGLLQRWQEDRFSSLIQTYLEELGEGSPSQNHVALYKRLLATQGCQQWSELSDDYYVQGAIQLSLAHHADKFLPEIIGFNLGYEQLPLHLLITAYELKELSIDPYYFTLHITIDNGDSGHAKKAIDAVYDAMPILGDSKEFYRRVRNGYKLNFTGENIHSIIKSFDINHEMANIFSKKGIVGRYAHSDYRQIAGRSLTDWLSDPNQSTHLITALENEGWFKRHQDPQNSRFWKLICGEKAKMAGVFNGYEQQVIYDWIAGDMVSDYAVVPSRRDGLKPHFTFESRQQLRQTVANKREDANQDVANDFADEIEMLESNLGSVTKCEDMMEMLISLMSPANHHSESGLAATRIFSSIWR